MYFISVNFFSLVFLVVIYIKVGANRSAYCFSFLNVQLRDNKVSCIQQ